MTPKQRIIELRTRQVWYGSSMVVKLNAVNGQFYYNVLGWVNKGSIDIKFTILAGEYNGEDPEDLIRIALKEIGIEKIKVGNLVTSGGQC